jgi:hypothetical protein
MTNLRQAAQQEPVAAQEKSCRTCSHRNPSLKVQDNQGACRECYFYSHYNCATPPAAQPKQQAEPIGKLIPCREGWFADIDNPPPTDGVYEIMPIFTLQPLSLQRQPLTKNQRLAVKTRANQAMIRNPNLAWSDALVFETEAAHNIKEQP